MPYDNNQEAFQAAQNGYREAMKAHDVVVSSVHDPNFGYEVDHLEQEINEAYQQINSALSLASEHQKEQLEDFRYQLDTIKTHIEE